tara:strand:- start:74975 stop:75118 length:144 start_codon:yes stop_codon:yes gene_type:complete
MIIGLIINKIWNERSNYNTNEIIDRLGWYLQNLILIKKWNFLFIDPN